MAGNQLFDYFKDTLKLLSADNAVIRNLSTIERVDVEIIVDDQLQELEGDYHTFLHVVNLVRLKELKLINEEVFFLSTKLRSDISIIPINLWNAKCFLENNEWKVIHLLAQNILNLL